MVCGVAEVVSDKATVAPVKGTKVTVQGLLHVAVPTTEIVTVTRF